MGITHLSGLEVAGVPTMGMGGAPFFTGNWYFVDPVNGSNGNTGAADSPFATLYWAHNKMTAGQNDVCVLVGNGASSGTARLSLALAQAVDSSVTAGTLVQNVAVTYTNQAGTTGRSTGTVAAPAAMIVGRMMQLPLQAGDTGVQGVTGVVGSVASAGTFNILVMRPLWSGRVRITNDGDTHDLAKTGMPELYADSALLLAVAPDSTATGIPEIELVIANA